MEKSFQVFCRALLIKANFGQREILNNHHLVSGDVLAIEKDREDNKRNWQSH